MTDNSLEGNVRKIEAVLEMARDAEPGSLEARLRDELELQLAGIGAARVRQRRARDESQELTRMLNQHLQAGRRAASRLRSCIRGILGLYTAHLKKFGIRPLKARRPARPTLASW